jgi:catecholate siderophore receptor
MNLRPSTRFFCIAVTACFASGSIALSAEAENDAEAEKDLLLLDKVHVSEQRVESRNYRVENSLTATKTNTPLSDVPRSITVVTEQQMRDQQMLGIADVARYVPGLSVHQGENNRDQLVFRGTSSSADFFLDGVRDDVQYYRDLYNLSRVEVLMGPDALVFGRGGGGGLINRVTKQAGVLSLRELVLQAGSYESWRASLDLNQPFSPTVAGRLNAFRESAGSFRDGVGLNRYAVNPTLTVSPSQETKVTLSYEYLHDTRTADRGITSFAGRPADVPISTFYGNPEDSHVRANVFFVSASIEHHVGGFLIRNRTTYGDYDRGYQNYVPGTVDAAKTLVSLSAYNNSTKRRNLFNQTDVVHAFTTGSLKHTVLAGAEFGRQNTDNFRETGYFNDTALSIAVPYASPTTSTPVTFRQSATDADNHVTTSLAAVYAQDQVELSDKLQAIAGLRFDSFDLQFNNHRNNERLSRKDELVSPRAGLVFKPIQTLSLYTSYSVSYLPSSGDQFASLTTVTQQVKPEKFSNYEVGAKWAATDAFTLNAAVYTLDRTNTRATDPNDPTRIVQTGSTRTRGLELGFIGSVTRAWAVSGGYAYQDAFIRSTTTAAVAGAKVASVPRHNITLWNKYALSPKLGIGLGMIYRSEIFAAVSNTVVLPGYTRFDAAVFYTVNKQWTLQANVENLLDRKYYSNADSNTNISPGSPFAVRLMVRTNF